MGDLKLNVSSDKRTRLEQFSKSRNMQSIIKRKKNLQHKQMSKGNSKDRIMNSKRKISKTRKNRKRNRKSRKRKNKRNKIEKLEKETERLERIERERKKLAKIEKIAREIIEIPIQFSQS